MTLRQLLREMSFPPERIDSLVAEEIARGSGSSLLDDTVKIEVEDQVYLDVKEVYFLPGTTTVIRAN